SIFSEVKQPIGEVGALPFIERDLYLENIHKTRFKTAPDGFGPHSKKKIKEGEYPYSPFLPQQETGIRHSCILPYELYVDAEVYKDSLGIHMKVDNTVFGKESSGAPFTV